MATLPQNRPCLILFISFIHESREFLCSLERKKPEVFKTHLTIVFRPLLVPVMTRVTRGPPIPVRD